MRKLKNLERNVDGTITLSQDADGSFLVSGRLPFRQAGAPPVRFANVGLADAVAYFDAAVEAYRLAV